MPRPAPQMARKATKTPREASGPRHGPITWQTASCAPTPTGWLFVLPVPERTNAIWRTWKGRTLVSARHRQDKQAAPATFHRCHPSPHDVRVSMTWYRARKAGDVDGRVKAALDLLRGIAYHDDRQVADLRIVRRDDPTQPARLEVHVEPIYQEAV